MTLKTKSISLSSLDARKAGETPYEFEFIWPDGEASGIWLSVIGEQTDEVQTAVKAMAREMARKDHAAQIRSRTGGNSLQDFEPDVSGRERGQRLAAIRLVGWRGPGQTEGLTPDQVKRFQGIEDAYSKENALLLCEANEDIAAAIIRKSSDVTLFIKTSASA